MCEIKDITWEHIGGFLGLGCHGEDDRVWERKRVFGKEEIRSWGNEKVVGSFCREKKMEVGELERMWVMGTMKEKKKRRKRKETVGNYYGNLKRPECRGG